MSSILFFVKTMSISSVSFSSRSGLGEFESVEVLHLGTYEEDGSVSWEVLVFPRECWMVWKYPHRSPALPRWQFCPRFWEMFIYIIYSISGLIKR